LIPFPVDELLMGVDGGMRYREDFDPRIRPPSGETMSRLNIPGIEKNALANNIVDEWKEILEHPKHKGDTRGKILSLQRDFLEHVRKRVSTENISDDEFRMFITVPVMNRTFMDKKFVDDSLEGASFAGRLGVHAYSDIMKLPGIKQIVPYSEKVLSILDEELFGVSPATTQKIIESHLPSDDRMSIEEAHERVVDASTQRLAKISWYNPEAILGHTLPMAARVTAEFLALKSAGLPLIPKTKFAKNFPRLAGIVAGGERLGELTTFMETPEKWITDPKGKTRDVVGAFATGAALSEVINVFPNPLVANAITVGGLGAYSYGSAIVSGADAEESMRGAMDTVSYLLAMQIFGGIEKYTKYKKAVRYQEDRLAAVFRKNSKPRVTNQEARLHARAMIAAMKVDGSKRSLKRIRNALQLIEKSGGTLTDSEVKALGQATDNIRKIVKENESIIKKADEYFINKTISKYPQKITDQKSLQEVGDKMAGDMVRAKLYWYEMLPTKGRGIRGMWFDPVFTSHRRTLSRMTGIPIDQIPMAGEAIIVKLKGKSQGDIKKTMVHELGHHAKRPYRGDTGRWLIHHPEFKSWVSAKEKELFTKIKKSITPEQKYVLEQQKLCRSLRRMVHERAGKAELSDNEMKAFMFEATGTTKIQNMRQMTSTQLHRMLNNIKNIANVEKIVKLENQLGLSDGEAKVIRKVSRNSENYVRILNDYVRRTGGSLSSDSTHRKMQLGSMKLDARLQRQYFKESAWNIFRHKENVSAANPRALQSTRYYLDYLSRVTGRPLRALAEIAEGQSKLGQEDWAIWGREWLKKMGVSQNSLLNLSRSSTEKISKYLVYRRETDKRALNPTELKIARGFAAEFDTGGHASNWIRKLKWQIWNAVSLQYEDKILKEMDKAKPNKRKIKGWQRQIRKFRPSDVTNENEAALITQGRSAKAQGKLDDWIADQTFGTRAVYGMTDADMDNLIADAYTLIKSPSLKLYEKNIKKAKIDMSELHARKGKARPVRTNLYLTFKRHAYRAATLSKMFDAFDAFNKEVMASSKYMHSQDRALMEAYRNTLLGNYTMTGPVSRELSHINQLWWDGYMHQPTRVLYFGYRNLFQPVGLLPGQISLPEYAKAAARIVGRGRSKEAIQAFQEYGQSEILQKRSMFETLMMSDPTSRISLPLAFRITDVGKHIIPLSDSLNRHICWWPIYELARHNIALWRAGKISTKKLHNRLQTNSMVEGERSRFVSFLEAGKDYEAKKLYSKVKTQNVNFVYDRWGRSIVEHYAGDKPVVGLKVWPTGAFEAYQQQCVKPIVNGIYTKNYRMAYEGIKNFSKTIVGMEVARNAMMVTLGSKGIVGLEAYGAFGSMSYSPLSPGLGWTVETIALFGKAEISRRRGDSPGEFFDKFLKTTSRQLEYFYPLVDVAVEVYEKAEDKDGVRFYHVLKDLLTDYDIAGDNLLKDHYRGLVEKWTTGIVGTEKKVKE